MTPNRLRAIRKAACPDLTQAAFARALGYTDADAYRKYESGARPVPTLLGKLAEMVERHGLPAEWRQNETGSGLAHATQKKETSR